MASRFRKLVHKTCGTWGETACGLLRWGARGEYNLSTTERWDRTTCKACLKHRKVKLTYKSINKFVLDYLKKHPKFGIKTDKEVTKTS